MSGLLTGRAFTQEFPEIDTTPTGTGSASLQGTVVAIYEIGCLAGSLFAFFFGDRFGRRKMIMMGCSILIVGAALQVSAYGIPHMIVSPLRLLAACPCPDPCDSGRSNCNGSRKRHEHVHSPRLAQRNNSSEIPRQGTQHRASDQHFRCRTYPENHPLVLTDTLPPFHR